MSLASFLISESPVSSFPSCFAFESSVSSFTSRLLSESPVSSFASFLPSKSLVSSFTSASDISFLLSSVPKFFLSFPSFSFFINTLSSVFEYDIFSRVSPTTFITSGLSTPPRESHKSRIWSIGTPFIPDTSKFFINVGISVVRQTLSFVTLSPATICTLPEACVAYNAERSLHACLFDESEGSHIKESVSISYGKPALMRASLFLSINISRVVPPLAFATSSAIFEPSFPNPDQKYALLGAVLNKSLIAARSNINYFPPFTIILNPVSNFSSNILSIIHF